MTVFKPSAASYTFHIRFVRRIVALYADTPTQPQNGFTHIFVSEFESEEDRAYYVNKDPAHLAFVKSLAGVVDKVQAVDFTPGVF